MITEERMRLDTITEEPKAPEMRQWRRLPEPKPRILRRRLRNPCRAPGNRAFFGGSSCSFVGLGLVMLDWPLAVSAIGAFIGVPLIIFGLSLMQAQER